MRIAQVAPLVESVPPRLYGGIERVVAYLTDELVRLGHEVTLFASGDSRTSAALVPCAPRALRLDIAARDWMPHALLQLDQVCRRADEFDVVHFHGDLLHLPVARAVLGNRALTTAHGPLDPPHYATVFGHFSDAQLVSISHSQRAPLSRANWVGNVYHGLPPSVCQFEPAPRADYLAFLGRMSPEKRPDRAIEIAARAGVKLKIAAKVDVADQDYFREHIEPLLSQPHVEYVGEIAERDKAEFLGNALALLFPIDWPEPFGLVLIEAMSCGTPCIAWRAGSVPEIVEPGISGSVVSSIDEAVAAVEKAARLDRRAIRARFERRFASERMAKDYLRVYEQCAAARADSCAA